MFESFIALFGSYGPTVVSVLQIIGIDILLAGDNAVVIALACRALPPEQRRIGIILGAGVAILLRIAFAAVVTTLLAVPFLKIVGGLLLFWIAIKLAIGEEHSDHEVAASDKLWKAVYTIAIADLVMSLDNVIAISGAAHGDISLIIFGLLLSIPLIIAGSTLISTLMAKYPIIIWAGAALLGWIAAEMITSDPWLVGVIGSFDPKLVKPSSADPSLLAPVGIIHYPAAIAGALIVIAAGWLLAKRRDKAQEA